MTILDTWLMLKELGDVLEISDGEIKILDNRPDYKVPVDLDDTMKKYKIICWFPEWLGLGGIKINNDLYYKQAIWIAFWEILL